MQKYHDGLHFNWRKRTPVILQSEAAECGVTSLLMVMNYYGANLDLLKIKSQNNLPSRGMNLYDLNKLAEKYHFDTEPVSIDIDELHELILPCVLHWDLTHFVVLTKIRKRYFTLHDPALGEIKVNKKELSQHFTGVALQISPAKGFEKNVEPKNLISLKALFSGVQGLKSACFKIFILSLAIEFFTLLLPMGNQLMMDHVLPAKDYGFLTLICIAMLLLTITQTFISVMREWMAIIFGTKLQLLWRKSMFRHLINLPVSFFERRKLGDVVSRFNSLDALRETFTTNIIQIVLDTIILIGASVIMMLYSPVLYFLVVFFLLIYISIRIVTYSHYRRISAEQIHKSALQSSHFMETLYCIASIKGMNMQSARLSCWHNLNVNELNVDLKSARFNIVYSTVSGLISALDSIIVLWVGIQLVIQNELSLGMLMAFNIYRSEFSMRSGNIIDSMVAIKMATLHQERVSDILLSEGEDLGTLQLLLPVSTDSLSLSCNNLAFSYDDFSQPIFKNLSFDVPAGSSLAITGGSGVGKTTLLKIMAGLLQPSSGEVQVNGKSIRKHGLGNYRSQIACVLQDDRLLSGTVNENISSFVTDPDRERIVFCAKQSSIHEEIMALPMGYDTLLSELGGTISGGQKQRILIARALYKQPVILFMDESTSHLDAANERKINQAISALNITRVIVAHRQTTIDSADVVLHLSDAQ
ncbi:peptidase domain-containing ABC transporter [Candidatus Pantoea multigeneris]|uniref:ABC-type xenobiotic transporter n=1 Tax=Candidatus Pantoea multigeneris TaxID=2608357 RepID=A0ABX0RAW7_9GAMM|nr:peptidase domain-containing ABC transporter [Pantoea multigeneris]NIF22500.1 peptidase domain-containing ABC transporter [Pantoea multigeneris]